MYIGKSKIKKETENGKDIDIIMKDGTELKINKGLLDILKTEGAGEGTITDNINNYFARKFISELSMYDLNYYFVNNISASMDTLAHNLREELFRKTFDCSGGDAIPLNQLIEQDEETDEDNLCNPS